MTVKNYFGCVVTPDGQLLFDKETELQCKCGKKCFKPAKGFLTELLLLRLDFGRSMSVISCCRCPEHNTKVKGTEPSATSPGSYHLITNRVSDGTCGIDVRTPDLEYRTRLVEVATRRGWSIGFNNGSLHLDCRFLYGQPQVFFHYSNSKLEN